MFNIKPEDYVQFEQKFPAAAQFLTHAALEKEREDLTNELKFRFTDARRRRWITNRFQELNWCLDKDAPVPNPDWGDGK